MRMALIQGTKNADRTRSRFCWFANGGYDRVAGLERLPPMLSRSPKLQLGCIQDIIKRDVE